VNLILNAIEAAGRHDGSPPKVIVEVRPLADSRVAISIKDSGPGPAENIRAKLFQPFVTEKPDGTGLGLFVAREIVEAHNGTIAWQHADGMTCFTLELPLERAHGSPAGS
jgi:signal transduction histidine kinase